MSPGSTTAGSQVTLILERVAHGDQAAAAQLFPLVYDELRRKARHYMARERPNHTLQPTALVHEVYLAMLGGEPLPYQSRAHFYYAAAQAMRRFLLQHARRRNRREAILPRIEVETIDAPISDPPAAGEIDHEALEAALVKLEAMDGRRHQVVMLRYFAGLPEQAVADALGLTVKTVQRDWATAKLFLRAEMQNSRR